MQPATPTMTMPASLATYRSSLAKITPTRTRAVHLAVIEYLLGTSNALRASGCVDTMPIAPRLELMAEAMKRLCQLRVSRH
ncbi:hypothetical protein SCUCBS95973_009868 [Sporothrix curviconia]|uniref:Uncharacterized protein n=1 Tax=Sporothrix curviconia TaxID=1260050 RepID=A0ABP0CYF7_9PEZI